jgi:hypothetical protein
METTNSAQVANASLPSRPEMALYFAKTVLLAPRYNLPQEEIWLTTNESVACAVTFALP